LKESIEKRAVWGLAIFFEVESQGIETQSWSGNCVNVRDIFWEVMLIFRSVKT